MGRRLEHGIVPAGYAARVTADIRTRGGLPTTSVVAPVRTSTESVLVVPPNLAPARRPASRGRCGTPAAAGEPGAGPPGIGPPVAARPGTTWHHCSRSASSCGQRQSAPEGEPAATQRPWTIAATISKPVSGRAPPSPARALGRSSLHHDPAAFSSRRPGDAGGGGFGHSHGMVALAAAHSGCGPANQDGPGRPEAEPAWRYQQLRCRFAIGVTAASC